MVLAFQAYCQALTAVLLFKYRERVLTVSDDDWPAVVSNLSNNQCNFSSSVTLYKAVVQETLLFGTDKYVLNPLIGRTLGGFHHRVYRCLSGMKLQRREQEIWGYLPLEDDVLLLGQ